MNINKRSFWKISCLGIFLCITLTICAQSKPNDFVVVLDAGHGGKDSGNRGNGYYEKKIALNTTLAIGEKLNKYPGIKVIYTRNNDRFIELDRRAKIANEADADLFVSIHCDAFTSSKAFGAGTFVLGLHRTKDNFRIAQKENSVIFLEEDYESTYDGFDPNNPESVISLVLMQEAYLDQSITAASTIQKSFVANLKRKDRTVKQAGFLVLRETYMPSVLVELGFLTNKKEGAYLNSSKGQREMALAISKAIINYKNILEVSVTQEAELNSTLKTADSTGKEAIKTSKKPNLVQEKAVINAAHKEQKKGSSKTTELGTFFYVQIAAGSKAIDPSPKNFKGLKSIERKVEGKINRYYYGKTTDYKVALWHKKKAIKKGYKYAFVVAFKNGVKVKLSDVISLE